MIRRAGFPVLGIALVCLVNAASAAANTGPAWKVTITPNAEVVLSGGESPGVYKVAAENIRRRTNQRFRNYITVKASVPAGTIQRKQWHFSNPVAHDGKN